MKRILEPNTMSEPKRYPFPERPEDVGYSLFPEDLESDPLVFFHGTAEGAYRSIVDEGFRSAAELHVAKDEEDEDTPNLSARSSLFPDEPLTSVAFFNESKHTLGYACKKRTEAISTT
jgi:hypothetical protein